MTWPETRRPHLVGNYRFTGKLMGKGNFARVEEAVHCSLDIKVAVKIIDINQIKEDYVIANLMREAKLMSRLTHPCIAALYETLHRANMYYLVTELASGGDLCNFVKEQRGGKLEERPTKIYARQFVSALAHMHHHGVVHRDLKMENVMLNAPRTQIKIVDFGLGNVWCPSEPLRTHCGSPEYAAPELFITGMKYGPEVDVWSLGIILYGMVIGQLPFVNERPDQLTPQELRKRLVAQINRGLVAGHKRAMARLTVDFRNAICRMLQTEINKRISVKDLLEHPFITEKGSRSIRAHPLRKLDKKHQLQILQQISGLTDYSPNELISKITYEPFGKIAGFYNILVHNYSLSKLSGDGIAKIKPTLPLHRVSSPDSLRRPFAIPESYIPKIVLQEKLPPKTAPPQNRPKTESKKEIRPKSVKEKREHKEVRNTFLGRKIASAQVPKTNRSTPVEKSSPNYKDVVSRMYAGKLGIKNEVKKAAPVMPKMDKKSALPPPPPPLIVKQEKLPIRNTQNKTKSDRPQTTAIIKRPLTRNLKLPRPSTSIPSEITPLAFGDAKELSKTKKPTIYDPIARSIAGYVTNNVTSKLGLYQFRK